MYFDVNNFDHHRYLMKPREPEKHSCNRQDRRSYTSVWKLTWSRQNKMMAEKDYPGSFRKILEFLTTDKSLWMRHRLVLAPR